MKKLLGYGFAAALVLFTALPALAKSYDVCQNAGDLVANVGTTITFVAAAPVYPGGTISSSVADVACPANPIGTFFAQGTVVGGVGASGPNDLAYVVWHFRINGQRAFDTGAFDTSGLVETTAMYTQTITGSTNFFVSPPNGTATVTNLAPNAFRIAVGF